jgi:hypothetical protein
MHSSRSSFDKMGLSEGELGRLDRLRGQVGFLLELWDDARAATKELGHVLAFSDRRIVDQVLARLDDQVRTGWAGGHR